MIKIKPIKEKPENKTFISLGTVINGNIECEGCLSVEGIVNGDLKAEGDVEVGDSARVLGNISANNVSVGGLVQGNINTPGLLKILSTARLEGDINVGGFMANEGGMFIGRCTMTKAPQKVLEAMFVDKRDKKFPLASLLGSK